MIVVLDVCISLFYFLLAINLSRQTTLTGLDTECTAAEISATEATAENRATGVLGTAGTTGSKGNTGDIKAAEVKIIL